MKSKCNGAVGMRLLQGVVMLTSIAVSTVSAAQTWQKQGGFVVPVVTLGGTCNAAVDSIGLTSDRSKLLSCQSGAWAKQSSSSERIEVTARANQTSVPPSCPVGYSSIWSKSGFGGDIPMVSNLGGTTSYFYIGLSGSVAQANVVDRASQQFLAAPTVQAGGTNMNWSINLCGKPAIASAYSEFTTTSNATAVPTPCPVGYSSVWSKSGLGADHPAVVNLGGTTAYFHISVTNGMAFVNIADSSSQRGLVSVTAQLWGTDKTWSLNLCAK